MRFNARDQSAQRRNPLIQSTGGGISHKNELAFQPGQFVIVLHQGDGRDFLAGIARRIPWPNGPIGFCPHGKQRLIAFDEAKLMHASFIIANMDDIGPGGYSEHFNYKPGRKLFKTDIKNLTGSARDAIKRLVLRYNNFAKGRIADKIMTAERLKRLQPSADCVPGVLAMFGHFFTQAGASARRNTDIAYRQHKRRILNRAHNVMVAMLQNAQPFLCGLGRIDAFRQPVGPGGVFFRVDDINTDGSRIAGGDPGNQLTIHGSRPRPSANGLNARLIDRDDNDRLVMEERQTLYNRPLAKLNTDDVCGMAPIFLK